MPILPNGASFQSSSIAGGSPRGWSFISTALTCWRWWALRYVFGLRPAETADALLLGSAYHAFMEGKSEAEVTREFPEHASDAKQLFERRKKGPPLPANSEVVIENEFSIFDGLMTSKPDRIERHAGKTIVRDFKTSSFFSENDEDSWGIDGGILGECVAANTDTALVDIVLKYQPKTGPGVKVVKVTLTPEKHGALRSQVDQFWTDAEWRVKTAAKLKTLDAFSQNLKGCIGKYGPCPYYARCWKRGQPESMMYRLPEQPPRNWATYGPGITWGKALEAVNAKLKKEV